MKLATVDKCNKHGSTHLHIYILTRDGEKLCRSTSQKDILFAAQPPSQNTGQNNVTLSKIIPHTRKNLNKELIRCHFTER